MSLLSSSPASHGELLDRRSLRSVDNMAGMPAWGRELSAGACALLIESRAASAALLQEQLAQHFCTPALGYAHDVP